MKTTSLKLKHVLTCVCILISITSFSQLTVNNSGQTRVANQLAVGATTNFVSNSLVSLSQTNTGSSDPYYGLYSSIVPGLNTYAGDCYGIFSEVVPTTQYVSSVHYVGVYGKIAKISSNAAKFGAGVVGLGNTYNGIGVYGGIGSGIPSSWVAGVYAGYFNGNVKVTGNVTATAYNTTSDMRLKDNIQNITPELATKVLELTPVSYTLKKDSVHFYFDENSKENQIHYGLLAQEIQNVYPELVTEGSDGYLSVNYQELLPMLIESMKGMNARIQELESALIDAQKNQNEPYKVQAKQGSNHTTSVLYQNNPNPYSTSTTIAYELPTNTQEAAIYIYDVNGIQLQKYEITTMGQSSIIISPNSLQAGMYLYSLIADGQLVGTKQMILTK